MNWLILVLAMETGFSSHQIGILLQPDGTSFSYSQPWVPYTEVGVTALLFDFVSLHGTITTDLRNESLNFAPFQALYVAGVTFSYKGLSAGWEHWCDHPVLMGQRLDRLYTEGDRLFVRAEMTMSH